MIFLLKYDFAEQRISTGMCDSADLGFPKGPKGGGCSVKRAHVVVEMLVRGHSNESYCEIH